MNESRDRSQQVHERHPVEEFPRLIEEFRDGVLTVYDLDLWIRSVAPSIPAEQVPELMGFLLSEMVKATSTQP